MEDSRKIEGRKMSGLSVIIPSKTASNLIPCLTAIADMEPVSSVIVVDDGVDWHGNLEGFNKLDQFPYLNLKIIDGEKPFCFSRNVNIGIRAALTNDVIIANDDTLLQTVGGFTKLHLAARQHPEFGVISAATNNVGNLNQHRRDASWRGGSPNSIREDSRMVCFVSVLIPRRTIDSVGLMDEEFGGFDDRGQEIYGFCDDSYCFRVRKAGLKIGIFDGTFVDHSQLKSTFRDGRTMSLELGLRQFIKKHGCDNFGNSKERSPWKHLFPVGPA